MKTKASRQRNLLHDHPLLRKGGKHEKTRKAKRKGERQALRREWFSQTAPSVVLENHSRLSAASSLQ